MVGGVGKQEYGVIDFAGSLIPDDKYSVDPRRCFAALLVYCSGAVILYETAGVLDSGQVRAKEAKKEGC